MRRFYFSGTGNKYIYKILLKVWQQGLWIITSNQDIVSAKESKNFLLFSIGEEK